jgi:hypothetical protein
MRLIAACLLCVGAAFAEPLVVATKLDPGWVLPTATMPESLWTNTVLWLTADSPVLNEGTTNAQWICYAKACSGNAVQTTLNHQPARVETNGVWALRFDGTDDSIVLGTPITSAVGDVIEARFDVLTNPQASAGFFRGILSAQSNLGVIGIGDSDNGRVALRENGGGTVIFSTGSYFKIANGMQTLGVEIQSTTNVLVSVDGVFKESVAVDLTGIPFNRIGDDAAGSARKLNADFTFVQISRPQ